jgi:hypothetical protein
MVISCRFLPGHKIIAGTAAPGRVARPAAEGVDYCPDCLSRMPIR